MSDSNTNSPVSAAKVAANRTNSLKSTGPRSASGKNNSRFNALKHGLLARQVVLRTGSLAEDPAEFNRLLADLWGLYRPVGILEELSVQEIAICYWKKARALRAERGDLQVHGTMPATDHLEMANVQMWTDRLPDPVAQSHLRGTAAGRDYLRSVLQKAREELQREGSLKHETVRTLEATFDSVTRKLSARVGALRAAEGVAMASGILQLLDEEERELERLQKSSDAVVAGAEAARLEAARIPSGEALHRLLRYEANNDRQLRWLTNHLERLQSARHERPVLPQVEVQISGAEE
jgi:hypothetical protein